MIIDAHQHVWDLSRAAYPWLGPDLHPIDRTFTQDEVLPELAAAGIDRVVLVQSADDARDTALMLDVADAYPDLVAGVVAWVPLDRPEEAADTLAELRRDPRVVGVRNLIHAQPDPDWIVGPAQDEGLGVLAAAGVPFDYVTGGPEALAHLPGIGERHPDLRIVIDHLGKPPVGGSAADRRRWRDLLAQAAANPRVHAKVSGLYGDPTDAWTADDLRPVVADALDLFGADRLMYGGDWPVNLLAGGYARVWEGVSVVLGELSSDERAAVLGGTASAFYALAAGRLPGQGRTLA
ncbi:amidohydrolase [Cellulomonas sp. URHD0024]|uniref:amidohydrolase family protein n=1 Tax=Cellulomonas sp. URHD0024 TaxID=1302620 RepID=UPI00041B0E05|nr:amidohydrolase family protein [Cellulomonas sp. URHD0024]